MIILRALPHREFYCASRSSSTRVLLLVLNYIGHRSPLQQQPRKSVRGTPSLATGVFVRGLFGVGVGPHRLHGNIREIDCIRFLQIPR